MKRRDLMMATTAATASLLVSAAPVPALAKADEPDTPILRLFRQHRAIMDASLGYTPVSTGKAEDEEMDRLFWCHTDKIEAEMMALPCTCAADFAAKVIVNTVQGELISDWVDGAIWVEARALTRSAV